MIYDDMAEAIESASDCIVCGAVAQYRGMYVPDDSQAYGAPKGMTRSVLYGICGRHIEMAQLIGDHVEAQFELDFGNNPIH